MDKVQHLSKALLFGARRSTRCHPEPAQRGERSLRVHKAPKPPVPMAAWTRVPRFAGGEAIGRFFADC
jgi:hypothetical protein